MRRKKRYVCKSKGCSVKSTKKLWNDTCNKCHEKLGASYTSGNYDLNELSQHERMLVFLYACGLDISWVFEKGVVTPEHPELSNNTQSYYDDLEEMAILPSFILKQCFSPEQEM